MGPRWIFIFSWWGFALSVLRLLKISPVSPLLILILNCLGTIVFLILKENIGLSVAMFVLLSHMIPVYIFRKDSIDIVGSMLFFVTYLLYLKLNGTYIQQVYNRILSEPMPSIRSYISSRLGI